jgi:RNA polymerase sigma factor (sigma-70 family)
MDDREVVAAIAAGDPAGIAVSYDRYAAGLYSYCHWMLDQPAPAAEAVRETFVVAATLGDLPEAPKLRPWLYAVARNECQRRLATMPADAGAAESPADLPDHSAAETGRPAEESDPEQAEWRELTQAVLAELEPDEREVLELSLRHDLYDSDLATVLGVSWSQAYALTSRARSRLEENLGALLIARTKREDCPALGALLADWDGQLLPEQTRGLIGEHMEHCALCAGHRRAALRAAALSGLQPMTEPPAVVRDEVMKLCSPTTPETPMYRRSAERVRPASFSEAIRTMRWNSIRSNPGAAIASLAVVLWIVAVVIVTLLTLTSSRSPQALAAGSTATASAASPQAATVPGTTPAAARTSAAARRSRSDTRPSADPSPAGGQSVPSTGRALQPSGPASSSPAARPSTSPSPKRSTSPSARPSTSPSAKPSTSPSVKPSTSPSASSSPTASGSTSPLSAAASR